MPEYDAIVIGGGPSGSTAAHYLARAGHKVAVLEKKRFPRAKTCGDGLTPRSIRVLEELGLASEFGDYHHVRGLRVLAANRTLELDFPKLHDWRDFGFVRRRRDLDAEIAEAARAAGADFRFGVQATEPLIENGSVVGARWVRKESADGGGVVKVDEGELTARFTLLADGAASPFGRALGIHRDDAYPLGLAIRTYYQSHRHQDDYFESWLDLRKNGELLPGYGWIFPVGDGTVNVGVGLLTTYGSWKDVNLNRLQRDYIDVLPKSYGITHEGQTEKFQSGRLPMGGSLARPYGPGYLVIGDAAGMVNPFNGEGIAYALETGKLAATLVGEALEHGSTTELSSYREALHDIYGAYYRVGRKFVKFIGNPRPFQILVNIGMRSQTIMQFALQVLANLGDRAGGGLNDRALRGLVRLAEYDLPDLPDPEIPSLSPRPEKVSVA